MYLEFFWLWLILIVATYFIALRVVRREFVVPILMLASLFMAFTGLILIEEGIKYPIGLDQNYHALDINYTLISSEDGNFLQTPIVLDSNTSQRTAYLDLNSSNDLSINFIGTTLWYMGIIIFVASPMFLLYSYSKRKKRGY